MAQLKGRTALITGATGGIGETIAARFLKEGANVMLVGRSQEKLTATHGRLGGGSNLAQSVADAADETATAAAVAATVKAFGGLDILVAAPRVRPSPSKPRQWTNSRVFCAPMSWVSGWR